MLRSLILAALAALAALALSACDSPSNSYVPPGEPQLTSLGGIHPWVQVKCKSSACAEAVLTTAAVSSGTITWSYPDGTTATGTTVTVTTPAPDSPIVMEVEIAYDNGDMGHSAVAIAGTRKRYFGEEEADPAPKMIVAEVTGGGCGKVYISSIGGCFDSTSPFTFSLWDGLADPSVSEPYAAMTPLDAATFTPSGGDPVFSGGASAAQVYYSSGASHQHPSSASIPALTQVLPSMTIEIDQATLPAITVLPTGSQGSSSWTQTEALTFQCDGADPFESLATIGGN